MSGVPIQRLIDPMETAAAVTWLCLPSSSGVRGVSLSVSVNPGRMLFIVMQGGSSLDKDLAQDAIAPLRVLERPMLSIGSLTEVEMIFTILPVPSESIIGTSALVNVWEACRCLLKGASKSSKSFSKSGPPGGPPELFTRMWMGPQRA